MEVIRAKKALGQHFLSESHSRRISQFANIAPQDIVIEIGPGTGQVTKFLLTSAHTVVGIEVDLKLVRHLEERFSDQLIQGSFHLIQCDVLKIDWAKLLESRILSPARTETQQTHSRPKVVGNLPYNIATHLIQKMSPAAEGFHSLTLMTQREVALRVLAEPGAKDYGWLSVFLSYHFERVKGFDVPPGAFRPPPKVTSHVFKLIPRSEKPYCVSEQEFFRVVHHAFLHRRKTLWNNLTALVPGSELERAFQEVGLARNCRAEQLSLEQFLRVSSVLSLTT